MSTNSNCGHKNMIGIDEAAEIIKALHFPLNTVEELNNLNSILVDVEVKKKLVNHINIKFLIVILYILHLFL